LKSTWFVDNILQGRSPDEQGKHAPPPLTAGSPANRLLVTSLKQDLIVLTRLARKCRKNREETGGAVGLSSSESGIELKFTLDAGLPTKAYAMECLEASSCITKMEFQEALSSEVA
jgi:hypothetical protein